MKGERGKLKKTSEEAGNVGCQSQCLAYWVNRNGRRSELSGLPDSRMSSSQLLPSNLQNDHCDNDYERFQVIYDSTKFHNFTSDYWCY